MNIQDYNLDYLNNVVHCTIVTFRARLMKMLYIVGTGSQRVNTRATPAMR